MNPHSINFPHVLKATNFIIFFLLSLFAQGQSNEFQLRAILNNLSFIGPGSNNIAYINSPVNDPSSTHIGNPYGNHGKLSYGLGITFQRNTNSKLIFGISSSYELLKSKMATYNSFIYENTSLKGSGENVLNLHFLNLHTFIGLNLLDNGSSRVDLKLLNEFGYLLDSHEDLTFNSTQRNFKFNYDRDHPDYDFRLGLGTSIYIDRIGLNLEYLIGLTNYDPNKNSKFVDVDNSILSRVFRLCISYSINKRDNPPTII